MANGFERLQQGLNQLQQGFTFAQNQKKLRQKNENLTTGVQQMDTAMAQLGVDPLRRQALAGAVIAGGGDNAVAALNSAFQTLSRPAKDQLNALQQQFLADRSAGTLTKEKIAIYQDKANAILKTNEIFSGALTTQESNQKIAEAKTKAQNAADIQYNLSVWKSKLQTDAAKEKYDYWFKKVKENKISTEEAKKASIPDIMNKDIFKDGMNDAQVEQNIMKMNPNLSSSARGELLWIYQHRSDDPKMKGFFQSIIQDIKKANIFDQRSGGEEPPVSAAPTNPMDVPNTLDSLANDNSGD